MRDSEGMYCIFTYLSEQSFLVQCLVFRDFLMHVMQLSMEAEVSGIQ
jgi:hypothetical protein